MIQIMEQLCSPYQSVATGLNSSTNFVRKMVIEASLADQIETYGYHIREPVSTIDFTKRAKHEVANNEQSKELKTAADAAPNE